MESGAADKDGVMSLKVSTKRFQWSKQLATFVAVFALLAQPMYGLVASRIASAAPGDIISISNSADLRNAIINQEAGQTWNLQYNPAGYALTPINDFTAGGANWLVSTNR